MEPSPLDTPHTPPSRTISEGPTPPPRNSMEDADSSVTRKRPRLDSGDRAYRSMSAEPSATINTSSDPSPSLPSEEPQSQEQYSPTQQRQPRFTLVRRHSGPPGEMADKAKERPKMGEILPTTEVDTESCNTQDVQQQQLQQSSGASGTAEELAIVAQDAAVSSPSQMGSPEIEVAEEDPHSHTGPTVWHKPGMVIERVEEQQQKLIMIFPLMAEYPTITQSFQRHRDLLVRGDLGEGEYLVEIARWMRQWLQISEGRPFSLFELYSSDVPFWNGITNIVLHLLDRSIGVSQPEFFCKNDSEDEKDNPITQVFTAFTAIFARFLHMDCQTLRETVNDIDVEPDLGSRAMAEACKIIMIGAVDTSPSLYRILRHCGRAPDSVAYEVVREFTASSNNGMDSLLSCVEMLLERTPLDWDFLSDLLLCARGISMHAGLGEKNLGDHQDHIIGQLIQLFKICNVKLQTMVSKQASFLTQDILKLVVETLRETLYNALLANDAAAEPFLPQDFDEHPTCMDFRSCDGFQRVMLCVMAWELDLCLKCITQGRMEIRIAGADFMQARFMDVYNRWLRNKPNAPENAVVKFGAHFLLERKVVDYLVGVESHPRLLSESKNIIGFLVISHTFGERETEMIWNAMISSQDPRIAEAILTALGIVSSYASYEFLLNFTKKLADLPTEAFHLRVPSFLNSILDFSAQKWRQGVPVDPLMFSLIVRLLREIPGVSSVPNKLKLEFFNRTLTQFRTMISFQSIDPEQRRLCLTETLQNISEGCSVASTGNIAALSQLWMAFPPVIVADIRELTSPEKFATLVVADYCRLEKTRQLLAFSVEEFGPLINERLNLIQSLIVRCSGSLSREVMASLWNGVVGKDALNDSARDEAWVKLAQVVMDTRGKQNNFLDYCVIRLFSELDSSFLTPKVHEFAVQLHEYEIWLSQNGVYLNEGDDSLVGGIFWHIALKASNQDTGIRAIYTFLELNVGGHGLYQKEILLARRTTVVERCLQYLSKATVELRRLSTGSASSDEDSMVVVPSEDDVRTAKLRCIRCLLILKMFMQQIRVTHPLSPMSVANSLSSQHSLAGEEMTIRYQPHVSGKPTGTFVLNIGDQSSLQDLIDYFSRKTGFSELQLIAAGQRVDQGSNAATPLRELKVLLTNTVVLIQKIPGSKSGKGNGAITPLSPLEQLVMNHFSDLYELLCLDGDLGCEAYTFLTTFPPHEDVSSAALDQDKESTDVFPMHCPYKALYAVYALKGTLVQKLQEGAQCNDLLQNGVQKIADVLIKLELPDDNGLGLMQTKLIGLLVDCMLRFLKEPVPDSVSDSYFMQYSTLNDRLGQLILAAQKGPTCQEKTILIHTCFAVSIEACLHSLPMWEYFQQNPNSDSFFKSLWLDCEDISVRLGTTRAVRAICTALPEPRRIDAQDFIAFFWTKIVEMIPDSVPYGSQAEQFFQLAIDLYRRMDDARAQALPLSDYLENWTACLLRYEHDEFVGRLPFDCIVEGFAALLDWTLTLLKARKQPFALPRNMLTNLFTTHVFPSFQVRDDDDIEPLKARVPVLHPKTRSSLYQLLLSLVTDPSSYHSLIKLSKGLIPTTPERTYAWSYGLAQISKDSCYDLAWHFDRNRAVRSPTGYAGMKNLSNTCYMNSLLMQLFMNVDFREFVLSTKLANAEGTQKLLQESKKLFAYLQETWLKAVDPENVVNCIPSDGQPLDVTVQMDVDEFYNILFDRWESQIASENDRKTFRKFYGGQLIQQIKSQDCDHISERFEPFSVIQCEIQGKTTLAESLSAFIEGEMMQGDNKYNCGTCNRKVNAIKRACLKDVPDNIIFHLKRFDWDIAAGIRHKVNDYFEFPEEIDLAPYHIDYVREDAQQKPPPDMFILVGVLVHSGNAEAGHYYSYVRERPGLKTSWVEMNDADVSAFDPAAIREQCFGGWADGQIPGMHFPKSWNAYMLFYQRISSMESEVQKFAPSDEHTPVRANIPLDLANCLTSENELWIRKFCLFGLEYADFVRRLLEQHGKIGDEQCSEDHGLERDLILMIVHQTEAIFAREKDCQKERDAMTDYLVKMMERCSSCCAIFLQAMISTEGTLRALLLRCPDELFRKRMQLLLFTSLKLLKSRVLRLYAPELDRSDPEPFSAQNVQRRGLFSETVAALRQLLLVMHLHTRVWDEYYGLLINMASMGRYEKAIVHSAGFLQFAVQLLYGESRPKVGYSWTHVELYLKHCRPKRRPSFKNMVALITLLIKGAEELSTDLENEASESDLEKYELYPEELNLITNVGGDPKYNIFLDSALTADLPRIAIQDLVHALLEGIQWEPFEKFIYHTLYVNLDPTAWAWPFLVGGLAFFEACTEHLWAKNFITRVAKEVQSIETSGGQEFLDFFKETYRIYNRYINPRDPEFFHNEVMRVTPLFAPPLLIYPDKEIRDGLRSFLGRILFQRDARDDEYLADAINATGKSLLQKCIEMGNEWGNDINRRDKTPLDSSTVEDFLAVAKECLSICVTDENDESDVLEGQVQRLAESLPVLAISSPNEVLSDADLNNSDDLPSDNDSDFSPLLVLDTD